VHEISWITAFESPAKGVLYSHSTPKLSKQKTQAMPLLWPVTKWIRQGAASSSANPRPEYWQESGTIRTKWALVPCGCELSPCRDRSGVNYQRPVYAETGAPVLDNGNVNNCAVGDWDFGGASF
jgi:hypothetical protein